MNAVTSTHDTAVPDSLDSMLAVAVYLRSLSPGCQLWAASTVFCHAYKTIGIPPGHARFSAFFLAPPNGPLIVSHFRTQPFGSTRAPGNWGRVTALFQWILLTYFSVHLPIYVYDCFIVELAETIHSAVSCVHTLAELCGFRLGNDQSPSPSISLLGATITFEQDGVIAVLPECMRNALIYDIEGILANGKLTPGQAAKIRGRLGFAQSLMFGKFGRVQLQPFTNRQYSRALRSAHAIDGEIRDVIPWRVHVLRKVSAMRTMTPGPRPVLVYTDAAGCGHLGVVLYVDGEALFFSSHSPGWMVDAQCDIYDLEMASSVVFVGELGTTGYVTGGNEYWFPPTQDVWSGRGRRTIPREGSVTLL